jgi:hypothetical protein
MKNLRMCSDCRDAIKLISKLFVSALAEGQDMLPSFWTWRLFW